VQRNHLPHSTEKQTAICMQIQRLLGQGVIKESTASDSGRSPAQRCGKRTGLFQALQ